MAWKSYELDQAAQKLVLAAKKRDKEVSKKDRESLNQAHKMRMAVAYGLERFWGEHLRLKDEKSQYWKDTWKTLVEIMDEAGVKIPNDPVKADDIRAIKAMSEKLWQLDLADQRVALAVLTQLCDCMVWWTQRYK